MPRTVAVAALVAVLATVAACSSEETPPTTTAGPTTTTTTLLAPASTTTLPPQAVTEVDVCGLVRRAELERLLGDDPGPGEPSPVDERDLDEGVPALITADCSWPTRGDPRVVLAYLAPTTARNGVAHVQDVLSVDTGFAEGGRVVPQTVGNLEMGLLVDADGNLREVAAVNGSALLYFLINQDVPADDARAIRDYTRILRAALVRAPR